MERPPPDPAETADRVRTLAGRLAHDFGNLVTVIQSCTELLLERTSRNDPSWELVDEIRRAGDRTGNLVRRLLAFARGHELTPTPVDLTALLTEMRSLVGRIAGPSVEVAFELEPGLPPIRADAGALEQVIVNLVVNARDAMPKGGRLVIATHALPTGPAADWVELIVSDTGAGIEPAGVGRVFDPVFTTEETGKGTGLGLTIVEGIVTQSGGRIRVESELGKGSAFHLEFPRHDTTAAAPPVSGGDATILIAEDDDVVRSLMRLSLAGHGYRLLEAGDGLEALAIAERFPGEIAALVTDVGMPRMAGAELAERLMARRPSLRVLFVTGYGADSVATPAAMRTRVATLEKPFAPDKLVATLRALLDRPG